MHYLKQSTAVTIKLGPFLDDSDGKTAETGLSIAQADIRLSKNGGNFAQVNDNQGGGNLSHDEAGWYDCDLDTTDTGTLGRLIVAVHESGALPVWREFTVIPSNEFDSLISGSDDLEVDATKIEGSDATDQINAAVDTAIETYHLDHLLAVTYDPSSKPGAADALLNELVENDGGVSRYTANALEQAPGGGGATPDVNVTQISGSSTAADHLEEWAEHGILTGAVSDAGPGSSQFDTDLSIADNEVNGRAIVFISGSLAGEVRIIEDSANTNGQLDVFPNFSAAPSNGDDFIILTIRNYTDAELGEMMWSYTEGGPDTWALLSGMNDPSAADIADAVLAEALADHTGAGSLSKAVADILGDTGTDGVVLANDAITAAKIAANAIGASEIASGAIDDDALAADTDTYQAKIWLIDDDGAGTPTDRYVVGWFKNSEPVTSGITDAKIQVIQASDGADLIAEDSMSQIGATGLYKYDETSNRVSNGAVYFAKCTATIGGSTRTWYQPVGRDSA